MQTLIYKVRFDTPAFLGNASQQAQWRTPPFKALLRQWWRVAKARELGYDHAKLLRAESVLFGSAFDDGKAVSGKSLLRLRLSTWSNGTLNQWWPNEPKLVHPEVKFPVGAELYLGYGPLAYNKSNKSVQLGVAKETNVTRTAIDVKAEAQLRLLFPDNYLTDLLPAIQLAAWFGTLGSRSRNGWGALHLDGESIEGLDRLSKDKLLPFCRDFSECLRLDWPHAIGQDENGPLVWLSESKNTWREAMQELARTKIAFRTRFKFTAAGLSERHILAYPVTNHTVNEWGKEGRLANQIRCKVAKHQDKYIGVIAHLPCGLPKPLADKVSRLPDQRSVWQAVHAILDHKNHGLSRIHKP